MKLLGAVIQILVAGIVGLLRLLPLEAQAYVVRVLVSQDQAAQAALRLGIPGITISARAYTSRVHSHEVGTWLADVLDEVQTDHCYQAVLHDIERARRVIAELSPYVKSTDA